MKTVLFVGAGRNQRRGIARVRELGARVVAVDANPDAPGLADADLGEAVDFSDVDAVAAAGDRHAVDGVMTFAADRAVPVVAAVAERLGLPGIGSETAHLATNKIAMRRRFAERGVPQPRFAAVRDTPRVACRRTDGRLPRRPQAGRLGRAARALPRAKRGRARCADGVDDRRVALGRGDRRGVHRRTRGEHAARRA